MSSLRGWSRLLESMRGRGRSPGAKFYKPVCLIAAIDLADAGLINPLDIDRTKVIDKFRDYVGPHFEKLAGIGWQPLWYLANDGIWNFLNEGRISGPKTVRGRLHQPRSQKAVFEKFDQMLIDPSLRPLWERPEARKLLRDELLTMLWRDSDPRSRTFARALFDPAVNEVPEHWPSPEAMEAHARAVSGEQDLFERPLSTATQEPETETEATTSAQIAEAIARLAQDPLGAQFEALNDSLAIRAEVAPDDDAVAARSLTQQFHMEVRRKLATFASQARRLDNQAGWSGIGGLCERLDDLLNRPTTEVPRVIGLVYSSALELGSFLEFDIELRRTTDAVPDPLDPLARRALDDLVRTLAPWVRLFPTAQQADDATGQFLARAALIPTAETTVEIARLTRVLKPGDAEVLKGLLEAARRGASVGDRAGARGVLSTRNMIVALVGAVGAVGSFYVDAISSDFATKSHLVQRAGTFLASAEAEVLALVADFPADLRLAIEALVRRSPVTSALPPSEMTIRPARHRDPAEDVGE